MIINFLNFRNNDITVRVYTDLFSVRGYEHGVESTKVLRLKDPDLYPTFSLIEVNFSKVSNFKSI